MLDDKLTNDHKNIKGKIQ